MISANYGKAQSRSSALRPSIFCTIIGKSIKWRMILWYGPKNCPEAILKTVPYAMLPAAPVTATLTGGSFIVALAPANSFLAKPLYPIFVLGCYRLNPLIWLVEADKALALMSYWLDRDYAVLPVLPPTKLNARIPAFSPTLLLSPIAIPYAISLHSLMTGVDLAPAPRLALELCISLFITP